MENHNTAYPEQWVKTRYRRRFVLDWRLWAHQLWMWLYACGADDFGPRLRDRCYRMLRKLGQWSERNRPLCVAYDAKLGRVKTLTADEIREQFRQWEQERQERRRIELEAI